MLDPAQHNSDDNAVRSRRRKCPCRDPLRVATWPRFLLRSRGVAHHGARQHGCERVVAAPEMMVKRCCGMKRNKAKENNPYRLMHPMELPADSPALTSHSRNLAQNTHDPPLTHTPDLTD